MEKKIVLIIGAGPAGLTAAYELLIRTDYQPIILEATNMMGGLSRTVNYKGNRIDIGGHRFFSKSDRVMNWWFSMMPLEKTAENLTGPEAKQTDHVLMVRKRLSRILFLRKFFDYPISISLRTITNLGFFRMLRIISSYLKICIKPIKKEKSLEDFFINRFGKELYKTFFKDYTQKVWGVPCNAIKPEWGAQRVKGVSIAAALKDAWKKLFTKSSSLSQKEVETSLIEQFLYPKFGPGQMWEHVAEEVKKKGGIIYTDHEVVAIQGNGQAITSVIALDKKNNSTVTFNADLCISTMPIKDLVHNLHGFAIPEVVSDVASNLTYRDFITVGLLLDSNNSEMQAKLSHFTMKDNWIYIQENDVKVGRLQIFNNWSPYMAADHLKTWVGLEYFCNEGDELWNMNDEKFILFAAQELEKIGLIAAEHVCDGTVIRSPKAYPAYFGSYAHFDTIKQYLNRIKNLYLIGRNGMHKYNNQDHAMLTAMTLVDNLVAGTASKDNLWLVNTEQTYHESKQQ